MKLKFVKGLSCLMLASAVLSGCGQSGELDTTSIYIRKDGSVSSAVYESFDTEQYDKEELQEFVEGLVSAYNQKEAGTAAAYTKDTEEDLVAAVKSLDFKDEEAILKMEYASCDDYMQFNETEGSIAQLASGTIAGAAEAGIDLGQFELLNPEGTEKINGSDAEEDYYVVFVEGTATLLVEGTIQYATADVKVEGKDTAQVSSEDSLSCIIFK